MSFNLVELFADPADQCFNQKCKYDNLVEGHAVYCHSPDPNAPRKCKRTWYTAGRVKDEDCSFYEENTNLEKDSQCGTDH